MKIESNSTAGDARPARRTRRLMAALLLPCGLAAAALGAKAPQEPADVERVRTALSEWVETRRMIADERADWELAEELLNSEIELLRESISSLQTDISAAAEDVSEADSRAEELMAERDRLEEASSGLAESVEALEARVRELLVLLPVPLAERLDLLVQQLPDEGEETKLSTAERYRNVVGILDQTNKFNREVTVSSEIREVGIGSEAEVEVIYFGIGAAYYVTADEQFGGTGRPTSEGWVWTARDDVAPQIAQAIRVYRVEDPAAFVQLPVQVD